MSLTLPAGPVTSDFRKSLDEHLAAIVPEGRRAAVLGVATENGVQFGAAFKSGEHWTLASGVEKAWGGPLSGHVLVMASW